MYVTSLLRCQSLRSEAWRLVRVRTQCKYAAMERSSCEAKDGKTLHPRDMSDLHDLSTQYSVLELLL